MNKDNYATLEAAQRLVFAGIVLRTDCGWYSGPEWKLETYAEHIPDKSMRIPAPSMAEVWRELPFQSYMEKMDDDSTMVWICSEDDELIKSEFIINTNPTDSLIDLLIWVRSQK